MFCGFTRLTKPEEHGSDKKSSNAVDGQVNK